MSVSLYSDRCCIVLGVNILMLYILDPHNFKGTNITTIYTYIQYYDSAVGRCIYIIYRFMSVSIYIVYTVMF